METPFDKVPGVVSTTSGYAGGSVKNPTYEQVSEGTTGHAEVVQVAFDPARVSYAQLVEIFWRNMDPTDAGRAVLRPGEPVPQRRSSTRARRRSGRPWSRGARSRPPVG